MVCVEEPIQILDTRGLQCPLPVLRLRKLFREAAAGIRVSVLATDRAAPRDIEALCHATGAVYLGVQEEIHPESGKVLRVEVRSPGGDS